MLTDTAALDIHDRTHGCLRRLMAHLASFSLDELRQTQEGFGYSTILEQLQHAIGAERYWMGVLRSEMLVDEDENDRVSLDTLEAFRARVAKDTQTLLLNMSSRDLDTPRTVTTWRDKTVEVKPSWVFMRTQMHMFHHMGQVAAMARQLGRAVPPGLDFPVV